MSTSIEIWRSLAGTEPDDFSLLVTVGDDNPYHTLDSPVTIGTLYIYKARRLDNATGLYSGWSPLLFLVANGGPAVNNLNTTVNSGIFTKIGIGVQPTGDPSQLVKATRRLSVTSFSPGKVGMKRIEVVELNGLPGVSGFVNGEALYPIKLAVNARPESFDELLSSFLGFPTTTAVAAPAAPAAPTVTTVGTAATTSRSYTIIARGPQGDSTASTATVLATGNAAPNGTNYDHITWLPVPGATSYLVILATNVIAQTQGLSANYQGQTGPVYAAPGSATGNVQLWNTNLGLAPVSIHAEYGPGLIRSYPGCFGDKMSLKFDKKSNTPFQIDADMMALNEIDGFTESAVGLDTATSDTLDPYAEAFSLVQIAGALADCSTFTASIDRNLAQKEVLSGFAGANTSYLQGAKHKLTATLYFSTDAEKQRYFGQVNQAGTYSQLNKVLYFPILVTVANKINGAGIVNQFSVYSAYATYVTVGEDVKGKEAIMQDIEIVPVVDPGSTGTDMQIMNVNSRSNASIVTPAALVTGFNGGDVNPYSN